MDTPTLAAYYKEQDPIKRKKLLEQSVAAGEDPEGNEIRKKLWNIRYREKSPVDPKTRSDAFLGLWMVMEFNRNAGGKMFGKGREKKEILKELEKNRIMEFLEQSELSKQIIYRECYHLVNMYCELCETDKSYGSTLFGLFSMKENDLKAKVKADLYETGIQLAQELEMEKELAPIVKAAQEVLDYKFHDEEPVTDFDDGDF